MAALGLRGRMPEISGGAAKNWCGGSSGEPWRWNNSDGGTADAVAVVRVQRRQRAMGAEPDRTGAGTDGPLQARRSQGLGKRKLRASRRRQAQPGSSVVKTRARKGDISGVAKILSGETEG
jgi:hypothetical protein